MSVGVNVIDEDHKKLLKLLNELEYINNADVAVKKGAIDSVISELMDYTKYHFDREELLMEACGYPGLKNHRQVHEVLKAQTQGLIDSHEKNPLFSHLSIWFLHEKNDFQYRL